MCLILFAYRQHPDYPLILAANRDEFYQRPSQTAHQWQDQAIFGGRDLEAGGTWLGLNAEGHFAALTNYREPHAKAPTDALSRGKLTQDFLAQRADAKDYWQQISPQRYAGFNLLLKDAQGLAYYSNRSPSGGYLQAGIYGLSNHLLDSSWPKVDSGKQQLTQILSRSTNTWPEALMAMLADRYQAEDNALPDTGVGIELERLLAPRFIQSEGYGTRTSSVLLQHADLSWEFYEQNFDAQGKAGELKRHHLPVQKIS